MNPLISIIIPTYNRAHLIEDTLNSILVQTYTNWECIIIDDGSIDNTEEILNQYSLKDKRFKFFKRPLDLVKGPCSCRNYGFDKSIGNYIKWFDSDDILVPNAIEKQITCLDKSIDVVVSKLALKDFEKEELIETSEIFSKNIIKDYLVGNISFYVSGPLWKRSFLEDKILFDSKIRNLDDWDFNLRMIYENPKFFYLEEVIIYYRIHQNSLIHELHKLNFEEVKSEFYARVKHLKILKEKKLEKIVKIQQEFIVVRSLFFLRNSLVSNHKEKYNFFILGLKYQFKYRFFKVFFKSGIGFWMYIFFNKGYRLLKY